MLINFEEWDRSVGQSCWEYSDMMLWTYRIIWDPTSDKTNHAGSKGIDVGIKAIECIFQTFCLLICGYEYAKNDDYGELHILKYTPSWSFFPVFAVLLQSSWGLLLGYQYLVHDLFLVMITFARLMKLGFDLMGNWFFVLFFFLSLDSSLRISMLLSILF